MARNGSMHAYFSMCLLVAVLLFQNLPTPVLSAAQSFEDQKTYYTPDPHAGSPPTVKCDPSPPSHKSPPTPKTPSPHTPTPYTPKTPSPHTPTTPVDPGTPNVPTPKTPTTPGTPPFLPDPNTPCTCDYWKKHPSLVWGVAGWFGLGSLGDAFGHSSLPGISPSLTCLDALSNTIPNGYGALYREGTAALLNSVATHKFPFTAEEVRNHFANGLGSISAASTKAQLFKMANEGKYNPKA